MTLDPADKTDLEAKLLDEICSSLLESTKLT